MKVDFHKLPTNVMLIGIEGELHDSRARRGLERLVHVKLQGLKVGSLSLFAMAVTEVMQSMFFRMTEFASSVCRVIHRG